MRRLKIALLSRWYHEENRRAGTPDGAMFQQLAEAVAALGHEVVVLSQSREVHALTQSSVGKLEVWLTPRERRRDLITGLRDKLAKSRYRHRKVHSDARDLADFLARRGPFDVLWAQCEEPDGLVAAVAAEERVKLPPLLTQVHSLRYDFEDGVAEFTEKAALGAAFRTAQRIIANSQPVAEFLDLYADPVGSLTNKVRVIHPNIDRAFLHAAELTQGIPSGEVITAEPGRVLFFGALNEKKGVLVFLEATLEMADRMPDAKFAIVGGFTEKNQSFDARWKRLLKEAQAKLGPERLELVGKIERAESIRQLQRASVVVTPSLFDEFSRATVEALMLGRPVVTTKTVGAWPLVNGHVCGLVVEPNDAAALASAIGAVIHHDGAHYTANAREYSHRLLHELSPDAIALQIVRQLEEIAAAPVAAS